jgi:pyruvate-ferredoxin/flavodoxin oxidoreductase
MTQKSGRLTVSHLRVSEHLFARLTWFRRQILRLPPAAVYRQIPDGGAPETCGIFLINTPYSVDEVWARLPQEVQAVLNQKKPASL